jgi:hypothetical protein
MSFNVTRDNWRSEIQNTVAHFEQIKRFGSSMYREAIWQYQDMAKGGQGGSIYFKLEEDWQENLVEALQPIEVKPTIRNYNYPGLPNEFFASVLIGLGEEL